MENNQLDLKLATYLTRKFKRIPNEEEFEYLNKIKAIQKKLPGRAVCNFTFKNNLLIDGQPAKIKYLKLGHVLEGQEAFIYERVNIKEESSEIFDNYVIGTNLKTTYNVNDKSVESKNVSPQHDRTKKIDSNNIYDKLYIQFIVEKKTENGVKNILFCQDYQQFLKEELFDIFAISGKLDEEFFNLLNIQLFFDPKFNNIKSETDKDNIRLRISISSPNKHVIETDTYRLD